MQKAIHLPYNPGVVPAIFFAFLSLATVLMILFLCSYSLVAVMLSLCALGIGRYGWLCLVDAQVSGIVFDGYTWRVQHAHGESPIVLTRVWRWSRYLLMIEYTRLGAPQRHWLYWAADNCTADKYRHLCRLLNDYASSAER